MNDMMLGSLKNIMLPGFSRDHYKWKKTLTIYSMVVEMVPIKGGNW